MVSFSLGKKKRAFIAVFAFMLLTPLIIFYSTSDNNFDTRSSAANSDSLPKNLKSADLNADGKVTILDYNILLEAYRNFVSKSVYSKSYDFNNDGKINYLDIAEWQNKYEKYKLWLANQNIEEVAITYQGEEVSKLVLKKKSAQLGTTFTNGEKVTWSSRNPFAITVDNNGKIQLVGEPGEKATIDAVSSSGAEASVLVVIDGEPSGAVTYGGKVFDGTVRNISLEEGFSAQLGTTFSNCSNLTWTSRNLSVVTIDNKGKLSVKGEEGRYTYVYATCDSNRTPQVRINVTKKTDSNGLTLNKTSGTIYLNSSNPKVFLKATTTNGKEITWSSSNTNVATVNKNGKVTAKAVGTSKIIAKAGDLTATYDLTVKQKIIIIVGASQVGRMKKNVSSYESGNYLYQKSDNTLKIIAEGGTGFAYQLPGGAGFDSMYLFMTGYSSVKKYIEFYVYFPIAGNGVTRYTCKKLTNSNSDISGYMENYSSTMASLAKESYQVKTYLVSIQPVAPEQCTDAECTAVESNDPNACKSGYRSNIKYYTYNKLMEEFLKNYNNLTYVETFKKIMNVNESTNEFTYKKGVKYVTDQHGIHWDEKTTVYYVGLMLESNTEL